jgi:Flp pilus assembly protein TadD
MRPDDNCEAGIQAFKSGEFDEAVRDLESATMDDPDNFRAFTYLGAAYVENGRYNAAIGALKRASEIRPEAAKVHYNLGQAYEAADVPREAWFEYKNALQCDPYYQPARTAMILLGARLTAMRQQRVQFA